MGISNCCDGVNDCLVYHDVKIIKWVMFLLTILLNIAYYLGHCRSPPLFFMIVVTSIIIIVELISQNAKTQIRKKRFETNNENNKPANYTLNQNPRCKETETH